MAQPQRNERPGRAPRLNPGHRESKDSRFSEHDLYLFNEGRDLRLYEKMGAHVVEGECPGVNFAVWAPDAERVSVIGDFNHWNREGHPLRPRGDSGIWEGFVPEIRPGTLYKFAVYSRHERRWLEKSDPFAFRTECPPKTASVVTRLDHEWGDAEWMERRGKAQNMEAPMSAYEVHLGSWRRRLEEQGRSLNYRELAEELAYYVKDMGFTHVELMPVMEHPFYGSWGYQITNYFAPTARYGSPEDFMYFVDHLHQEGIGVILDWVPSHFPSDAHGLAEFDGTHLFEHADPRKGFHPDWNSYIFNYGRHEVRGFLLSNALFWLDRYHIDGLRVDAVASMLYLDYSRKEGEWIPNEFGGRENTEAIVFLRQLNEMAYEYHPDIQMIAEESTAWPMVSRPTYIGGLGFGMKWDMGWMHDTLKYLSNDSVHRKYHHNQITFRMIYAFNENFVLSLSHDEVVHGKGSLLNKMPGDDWRKFANLRLLFGNMFAQPGKKLIFMGGEFGQRAEWNHDSSLEWHLLSQPLHQGVQKWVRDLNHVYRAEPALAQTDFRPEGFEWIDASDTEQSIISFVRRSRDGQSMMVAVFNFTPVPRENYRIGMPAPGRWWEMLNSDRPEYGGSGVGNPDRMVVESKPAHGRDFSLNLTLPPLGMLLLKWEG